MKGSETRRCLLDARGVDRMLFEPDEMSQPLMLVITTHARETLLLTDSRYVSSFAPPGTGLSHSRAPNSIPDQGIKDE